MIGVELALLLRRRRVWLCWALLCALPTAIAILLAVTKIVCDRIEALQPFGHFIEG